MKNFSIILGAIILVSVFSMCNNTSEHDMHQHAGHGKHDSVSGKDMKGEGNACVVPVSAEDSAKYISKQVEVKGDIEHPLVITVDSLKKMKVATIENFKVVCQSGANMKENITCKGVLLRDILEKAVIKQNNHKDRNFYIVARASDNYKATFSWAEIFNNPTGDNVYVLFEENEQPIKKQGDMILICKNDIKTGPRHVYWLKSIEVNRVD